MTSEIVWPDLIIDYLSFFLFPIMASTSPALFCVGNPLLDMQVTNGEELLAKYELKANDAILAEEKHAPMYGQFFF